MAAAAAERPPPTQPPPPHGERPRHNFAPASGRDTAVFGASMPGCADPLPPPGSVGPAAVAEWASFVRARGVTDVVILLGDDELACYAPPGLAEGCRAEGLAPHLLRARAPGAAAKIMAVLDECAAYGLSFEEATAEVEAYAAAAGVQRRVPSWERFRWFVSGEGW
ncbi:hypothetical protein Rsub_02601 [Raphidocelis subcapitata]|uniref:Uncharacterized protein n=1 Tax=Raphidocelis subcapitata TaxID=307507 RepID=A0A2V0NY95_9CHLO|nr:hypothetical protein Rsub_02601 [Raphidocelis subcapitata]|eukprot:GBF89897.1 hypothetical protein Rsub_02601 [Raphidocelis subcapitata]